jgi:hypothetical protein
VFLYLTWPTPRVYAGLASAIAASAVAFPNSSVIDRAMRSARSGSAAATAVAMFSERPDLRARIGD